MSHHAATREAQTVGPPTTESASLHCAVRHRTYYFFPSVHIFFPSVHISPSPDLRPAGWKEASFPTPFPAFFGKPSDFPAKILSLRINPLLLKFGNSAKKVRELGEKVRELGEKVRELGEKVRELGEKVRELGEKVRELGEKVRELGEKSLGTRRKKSERNFDLIRKRPTILAATGRSQHWTRTNRINRIAQTS